MDEQQWLSITDVATALKVGEPTVQHLIDHGMLETEQTNDGVRVSHAALIAFLKADQQTLDQGQQPPEVAVLPPGDV